MADGAGVGASGRRFPVAVGEFGSFFSAVQSSALWNLEN